MTNRVDIESATGAVRIGEVNIRLSKDATKVEVEDALSAHLKSAQDHGNGYEWLYFHQLSFNGKEASLSVCFYRGLLREVHWGVNLRGNAEDNSWPTPQECKQEAEFVRSALCTSLGRTFSNGKEIFAWGEVWSLYNERDGFTSSGVRYAA